MCTCEATRPTRPPASLGRSVHDPTDPVGRLLFNVLAMIAEFEADLIRARTREGMKIAKAKGRLKGKQPKLTPRLEARLVAAHATGEYTAAELADEFRLAGRPSTARSIARAPGRQPKTLPDRPAWLRRQRERRTAAARDW